jgi:hypothetical protein
MIEDVVKVVVDSDATILLLSADDADAVVLCVNDDSIEGENTAVIDGFGESDGISEEDGNTVGDSVTVLLSLNQAVIERLFSGVLLSKFDTEDDPLWELEGTDGKADVDTLIFDEGDAAMLVVAPNRPLNCMRGWYSVLETVFTLQIDVASNADIFAHVELRSVAINPLFDTINVEVDATQFEGIWTFAMQSFRVVDVSK